MGFEVQKKFIDSHIFKAYYREAMDSGSVYIGKIWSIPMVKNICNEFLEGFLKSRDESFKDYFMKRIEEKFKKKRSRQRLINYILTLFFSIQKSAEECYEMDVVKTFFKSSWKKSVFKNWKRTRIAIFRAKGLNYSSKMDLSELFLKKSEVLILAQRTCHESIEVFEKWLDEEISKLKELRVKVKRGDQDAVAQLEKDQKFYKMDKTASSAVLWKVMRYYFKIEINEKDKERRNQLTKKIAGLMADTGNQVIELDENGNIVSGDKISRTSSIHDEEERKEEEIENMKNEKNALVKEIQRNHREANLKYQACILMIGFMKSMESLEKEAKEMAQEASERLNVYANYIEDEELQRRMFAKMGGYYGKEYFDKGTKIEDESFQNVMKTLKKTPEVVKFNVDLEHRSRAYGTRCSQFKNLMYFLVHKVDSRFKVKKLSKKEKEQKDIEFVNDGIKQGYTVKNIKMMKDRPKNDIIDRSVMMESDIHDVFDDELMHSLTLKLIERSKTDRNYLEDPDFTSTNQIKTKAKRFTKFSRQQSVISENMSEVSEDGGKETGRKEKSEEEGIMNSIIVENPEEQDDFGEEAKDNIEDEEIKVDEGENTEGVLEISSGEINENEPEEKKEEIIKEEMKEKEPEVQKKEGFFDKVKRVAKETVNNVIDNA